MFLPPGANSRWVPLKRIDWSVSMSAWKGANNDWALGAYSNPTASGPFDVTEPPAYFEKWQDGEWYGL
jgi:hypothetical protein